MDRRPSRRRTCAHRMEVSALVATLALLAAIGPARARAGEPPPPTPQPAAPAPAPAQQERPFRMGFTRWPADLTLAGVRLAEGFAHAHGDIVSVTMIGGIPWPEALEGRPFSRDVQQAFSYRPPNGQAVFLSICPLDMERKGLAPYWGEKDNLPLPPGWAGRTLDHPEVVRAYVAFVLRAVEAMEPAVLAVGVENNVLLTQDPKAWPALKTLHRAAYAAVKKARPTLPVCFTTEVNHYRGHTKEAKRSVQEAEVADLMRDSDLFALSLYPFMSLDTPRPVPADFLDFATKLGKPVAISESGMTSRDVRLDTWKVTLRGSDEEQRHWIDLLLRTAARDRYRFVVQFATTDFPALVARLPNPTADLARIWAYTGMQTDTGAPKPALAVWDRWFAAKLAPPPRPAGGGLLKDTVAPDPDAPSIVVFGKTAGRMDEVIRLLRDLGGVSAYGAFTEEEALARIAGVPRLRLVLLGGAVEDASRRRIRAELSKHHPGVPTSEPGVRYPYSDENIRADVRAKLSVTGK